VKAGALRHFLTVEQDAGPRDAPDWQLYCERHGEVREVAGSTARRGAIVTAEVLSEVYLRADSETVLITPQMRIRFTNRFGQAKILDVLAVLDETGKGRELKIECRRNAAC
jgi:head-tail adaptor